MSWSNPSAPNLPDYILFLQGGLLGIPTEVLPTNSPYIEYAFNRAMNLVLNVPTSLPGIEYTMAVYNCAAHIQLTITPDVVVGGVSYGWFVARRKEYDLLSSSAGLVSATSDQSTSSTFAVSDAMSQLTIGDLQFFKTYWGREFLSFQQDYGPTVWGLS